MENKVDVATKETESVSEEIDMESNVEIKITNQEWLQWIKENGHDVGKIEGTEIDFSFIDEIASNKKYLFLGESAHGVSEYIAFKVALIKYLHEKHDFDVLAFETGLAEASSSFAHINSSDSEMALKNSVYPIWQTEEILPLFDYIKDKRQTEDPLILTGVDMQPTGTFPEFIGNWVKKIDPKMSEKMVDLEVMFRDNVLYSRELIKDHFIEDKEELLKGYQESIEFIDTHEKELQNVYPDRPELTTITKKTFENRMKSITDIYTIHDIGSAQLLELRNQIMADNLEWLSQTIYPDKKILVWSHNNQIRDNHSQVETEFFEMNPYDNKNMFQYLPEKTKNDSYSLGLYMFEGTSAGYGGQEYEINSQHVAYEKDSLERLLNVASGHTVFVNIEEQTEKPGNSWMFQPMFALDFGLYKERLIVKNHYDGIMLFKEVHSPKYLD
jgi:erythromycin esterase